MKKILVVIIPLILMPILVNAKTLTYNVCKNGCEYNELNDVFGSINDEINNDSTTDKNIIINILDTEEYSLAEQVYVTNETIKSFIINGGNSKILVKKFRVGAHYIDYNNITFVNSFHQTDVENVILRGIDVKINNVDFKEYLDNNKIDINTLTNELNSNKDLSAMMIRAKNATINKLKVSAIQIISYNFPDYTDIETNISNSSINMLSLQGKTTIDNSQIFNLSNYGGSCIISNSKIGYIFDSSYYDNSTIKCNNCSLYKGIYYYSSNQLDSILSGNYPTIYDYITEPYNSNTEVYFDKEAEIRVDDKINLVEYLDYYTNDKEISYTIEDESIAKIENKELIGLKPGNTKVQVTTDDGHIIYNIDLTVYTISEKKVTMKAETKLKLNSVFKDLDISNINDGVWEISNPKVAKVVNGEIISLQKGETDIVAIINGVKYVYHLTVSDTLVSKEIKVPITGNNIKLWIIIVTVLLLSVIGVCSYMLIKSRK